MNAATLQRHYYIRSFILLGFTFLLADLVFTGRLSHYLAPRLHVLSYVTLAILFILSGVSLRQAIVGASPYDCDCADAHSVPRSAWKAFLVYGLFLLPIVMGLFMPDKTLGSAVAEKRGVNVLSGQLQNRPMSPAVPTAPASMPIAAAEAGQQEAGQAKEKQPLTDEQVRKRFEQNDFGDFYTDLAVSLYKQPVIQLDEKIFLDGLTTLELYPKEFAGKELETIGFVYREPSFKPQQFVVARFSVSCCTADATVFGILVEEKQAAKWATDSWVKVRGKLEVRQVDGYDMLVLRATGIEPAKAPKDPYVYYNFDAAGVGP
jgi:putative membrane protein